MQKVCSYCKGSEKSVEHSRPKDCPKYHAYRKRKKKNALKGAGARPDSPRRRASGRPGGLESTLARLKTKRDEIDAAIRTLEAVEGLLT